MIPAPYFELVRDLFPDSVCVQGNSAKLVDLYVVPSAQSPAVVILRDVDGKWMGLTETGAPKLFCSNKLLLKNGTLVWQLQYVRSTGESMRVVAHEKKPQWVDASDCILNTSLQNVFALHWRPYTALTGRVRTAWLVNNEFAYDEAKLSRATIDAVMDSMLVPLEEVPLEEVPLEVPLEEVPLEVLLEEVPL